MPPTSSCRWPSKCRPETSGHLAMTDCTWAGSTPGWTLTRTALMAAGPRAGMADERAAAALDDLRLGAAQVDVRSARL